MPQHKRKKPTPRTEPETTSITVHGNGNAVAAHGGRASVSFNEGFEVGALESWRKQMETEIDTLKGFPEEDKASLRETIAKIAHEAEKGEAANGNRLERLLNSIGVMAPDIFDVAVTTLANPLAGLSLMVKKIGNKATVMQKA